MVSMNDAVEHFTNGYGMVIGPVGDLRNCLDAGILALDDSQYCLFKTLVKATPPQDKKVVISSCR